MKSADSDDPVVDKKSKKGIRLYLAKLFLHLFFSVKEEKEERERTAK